MAFTLNPEKALIFRIIHRSNLPWILEHGLHAPNGAAFDPNHHNIGNVDLIGKRTQRTVTEAPGGTLSDYVPFYFTPFSIMMYNIHTGYNVTRVPNEEILILVSSLNRISELHIPFVFTDQHAYLKTANCYRLREDLANIDWNLLNSRNFQHDPDNPSKKDRYQAEALIWKYVPLEALLGICSYTDEVDGWVKAELTQRKLKMNTNVQRNWYF
ncbi:MAG TPA: DUF4433 domain-containing protein [Acidobacteriaceae bacterium]